MTSSLSMPDEAQHADGVTNREGTDETVRGPSIIDRNASFARFVYPFAFDPDTFSDRLQTLASSKWCAGERELPVWETGRFPESDLLAHVRNYLTVGESDSVVDKAAIPTARFMKLTHEAMHSTAGLGCGADWSMEFDHRRLPFRWNGVSLVLFHSGIGILVLDATPTGEHLDCWLDFVHFFRCIGRKSIEIAARRRVEKDTYVPFFPSPAGGIDQHPDGRGQVQDIIAACLNTGQLPDDEPAWWQEVFVPGRTLSYVALFADEVSKDDQMPTVYRLRNSFHAHQEIHPAPGDLSPDHRSLMPYVDRQWFIMSLEGGSFVAFDAALTPFFRQTLPEHLRNQYFLLFLLVVYQRFFLTRSLDEIAAEWLRVERQTLANRARSFNRIRKRLFAFKARGYFAQAMQREHHHDCYRKWQEVLQTDRLYDEVNSSVGDMHNYLKTQNEQARSRGLDQLQAFIAVLTAVFGVPGLLFALLGINRPSVESGWDGILAGLGLGLAAMFLGLLIMVPLLIGLRRWNQLKD